MKKQSGFTLIELLLVLAIIGIISAIAIPALLGQRARARDKSALSNMTAIIPDMVGGYDKTKDANSAPATAAAFITACMGTSTTPLIPEYFTAVNPWQTTGATNGYSVLGTEANINGGTTSGAAVAGTQGQVQIGYMVPPAGGQGCLVAAVYTNGQQANTGGPSNVSMLLAGID